MQLIVPVVQVEGNLLKSRYFRADSIILATPDSCRWNLLYTYIHIFPGSELVGKQLQSSGLFFRLGNNVLLPPFINGMVNITPRGGYYLTLGGPPHLVIVTTGDNKDYTRVLSYSYYTHYYRGGSSYSIFSTTVLPTATQVVGLPPKPLRPNKLE